jgi:two-component system, NarL family, nitrate/nitrite response regulator NarL
MAGGSQSTGTVIVARSALLREGVAALLKHTPYKIVATAQRPSELNDLPRATSGSRLLIVVGMDESNGEASALSENVRLLRSLFPGGAIVVIAESHSQVNVQQIVKAGPNCYVANLSSRDVLLKILEVALLDQQATLLSRPNTSITYGNESKLANLSNSGNELGDLRVLAARKFSARDPQLSQREREILVRLVKGNSNKEIARLCNITESTVKVHLKAILRKITVQNRTQAAIWAIAKGYHVFAGPKDNAEKPSREASESSHSPAQLRSGNGSSLKMVTSAK